MNNNSDTLVVGFKETLRTRLLHCSIPSLMIAVFAWMGMIFVLQEYLVPNWTPLYRAIMSAAIALPLGVVWAVVLFYTRIYGVTICENTLEFFRKIPLAKIPLDELVVAAGVGGLDVSGGELITWKRLVLGTPTRTVTLRYDPMVNSEIYAALVRRAKKMAGVPFPLSHIDGEFESPQILSRVSSLFVRSAATKFMCGFVLLAVIATLVILAISRGEPKSLNNGAYAICVGAIGGFYLMLASMRDFNIPRKLRRILQSKAMNTESR